MATAARNSSSQPIDDEAAQQNSALVMSKLKTSPAPSSECTTEDVTNSCPLFMDSLPSNFASNSGLAAIASLLDDESNNNDKNEKTAGIRTPETKLKPGGGKATKKRIGIRHSPYKSPNSGERRHDETTVGEAQLFLSMWKV